MREDVGMAMKRGAIKTHHARLQALTDATIMCQLQFSAHTRPSAADLAEDETIANQLNDLPPV